MNEFLQTRLQLSYNRLYRYYNTFATSLVKMSLAVFVYTLLHKLELTFTLYYIV